MRFVIADLQPRAWSLGSGGVAGGVVSDVVDDVVGGVVDGVVVMWLVVWLVVSGGLLDEKFNGERAKAEWLQI